MNEYCTKLIKDILDLKRKNGKFLMEKPEQRSLLEKFLVFNLESDTIDTKDHTKIGKLLMMYIPKFIELYGMAHYGYVEYLDIDKQFSIKKGQANYNALRDNLAKIAPIRERWVEMKKRVTRGGSLPKEERIREKRAAIKGKLSPMLFEFLTNLKERWKVIIYDNEVERMNSMREVVKGWLAKHNITNSTNYVKWEREIRETYSYYVGKRWLIEGKNNILSLITDETIESHAKYVAENEAEGFFYKMADKLGGLVLADGIEKIEESGNNRTPFESTIDVKIKGNSSFTVTNKIVINRSPLDNEFYQYPCTFHNVIVKGEKLEVPSEASIKQAFLKAQ